MQDETTDSADYFVREQAYLRDTYAALRKETRELETYTLLAVGAIWSWCAANSGTGHIAYLVWLPVVIVGLFGMRAFGVYLHMRALNRYLSTLESRLCDSTGWMHFAAASDYRWIWPATAFVFWVTLTVLTLLVPFVLR